MDENEIKIWNINITVIMMRLKFKLIKYKSKKKNVANVDCALVDFIVYILRSCHAR